MGPRVTGRPSTGPDAQASAGSGRFSKLVHLAETDSTNRYCLDEARAGAPEGLVVLADYQRAGRGRRGRTWSAPPGGALLCSVLVRPQLRPEELHLVPSAVALATLDALFAVSGVRARLKWPNDLVLDGGKLGGILTEAETDGRGTAALVVGLGLNLAFPDGFVPAGLEPAGLAPVTLEQCSGRRVRNTELLACLLTALDRRYGALYDRSGRDRERRDYRAALETLGRSVRVETAEGRLVGVATDLADDGRLVVRTETDEVRIAVGDVAHLREEVAPGTPDAGEPHK